jgi:ribonuclease-3
MYNPYNPKNRLLSVANIQNILEKQGCSGFKVQNASLYQTAMVHSSYVKRLEYTTPTGEPTELSPRPPGCLDLFEDSYERLEHLGDSVLGACVSTYLMERFPSENEGFLTDLKKEIVCNETLGKMNQKIGLDVFYVISRHNEDICFGRSNIKKLGDILEAFIGALWVDSNYNFQIIYKFVVSLIEQYIDIPKLLLNNRNFKEQFQKLYQSIFHATPTYSMISFENGIYKMAVNDMNGQIVGKGEASTKKQAEQFAAREAITHYKQYTTN